MERWDSRVLETVRSLMNTPLDIRSEKSEIADEKTRTELWYELRKLCNRIANDDRVAGEVLDSVTVEHLDKLRTRMENRSLNFTLGLSKDLRDTREELERDYFRATEEILRQENERKAEALRLEKERKAEALRLEKEAREERKRQDDMVKFIVTVVTGAAVTILCSVIFAFKLGGRH